MNDRDAKHIIDNIKQRRLDLGYSYQDLANKTGISKSTLQRYETGFIKNLSIDKLEVLAKALDIDPAYLMGWDEPSHTDTEDELFDAGPHAFKKGFSLQHVYLAVDILTPHLVKKGYAVEFSEDGQLGKIIASKSRVVWHLDFYLPDIDDSELGNSKPMAPSYSDLLHLYGKIVIHNEDITKYTLVVNDEYIMEKILKKRPHNLSIETSVILVDLKDKTIIKELEL